MKFTQVVESRRSIRGYKEKKVDKAVIEKLIKTASLAPSWKNSQTARYYVVMSDEMLKEVKEKCLPSFNASRVENAPVLIVETFVTKISGHDANGMPANECGDGWGYYDLGLQTENLILGAREQGLDTLIMGLRHEAELRELLNIPKEEAVAAVISVGYRAVDPEMPKRKDLSEIAKFF